MSITTNDEARDKGTARLPTGPPSWPMAEAVDIWGQAVQAAGWGWIRPWETSKDLPQHRSFLSAATFFAAKPGGLVKAMNRKVWQNKILPNIILSFFVEIALFFI